MKFTHQLQFFFRSFFLQAGWNYMKFQHIGLTFVMLPFLKRLYRKDKDALPSVLSRYLETFNTQPIMASFCIGALAKQEEKIAHAPDMKDFNEQVEQWDDLKQELTITTASIGDRLFWGTLKPMTLLLALFIWVAMGINFFEVELPAQLPVWYALTGSAMAFCVFNSVALFVKWKGLQISYNADEKNCFGLTGFDWNKTIFYARRIAFVLTVAMLVTGLYEFLKEVVLLDVHFVTRALIVIFFICICFITRRLRIPNMYLYLAAVAVFNIVCYL